MPESELHIVADGAHIPTETGMVHKLIKATEALKIYFEKIMHFNINDYNKN